MLVAQRANRRQAAAWGDVVAAFALDRLKHDSDRLLGNQPLNRCKIVKPGLREAWYLWLKPLAEARLAGRGHGCQRAAVKSAFEGNDLIGAIAVPLTVFAGEFDRAFIGFRAGIGEEHLIETTAIDQGPCQLEARGIVESRTWRQQ